MESIRAAIDTLRATGRVRESIPATEILTALGLTPTLVTPGQGAGAGADRPAALGRFRIGRELGRGGMGRVVEAHDPDLQRDVAIKLLADGSAAGRDQIVRFVTEAQITGQLDHPNIVPVHELGITPDGQVFLVMKRVRGRSLREILDDLDAGVPEVTAMFGSFQLLMAFVVCCGAVAYANERGILHRDLKPENLMIGEFIDILVLDWGVARRIGGPPERLETDLLGEVSISRTVAGSIIGTPGYMSPEQARGELERLDARSDVWSLGAVLFELLTLRPAIARTTVQSMLLHTISEPAPDPREVRHAAVPDVLAQACMKAMAPEPDDRFPTARDLAFVVGGYLAESERRHRLGPPG